MVKNLIYVVCMVAFFVRLREMEKKRGQYRSLDGAYLINVLFVMLAADVCL